MLGLVVVPAVVLAISLASRWPGRYGGTAGRAPAAAALLGSEVRGRAVSGWPGPPGPASVLFGLLALEELTGADAGFVAEVVVVAVVLSAVVPGLTAGPVAASLGDSGTEEKAEAIVATHQAELPPR